MIIYIFIDYIYIFIDGGLCQKKKEEEGRRRKEKRERKGEDGETREIRGRYLDSKIDFIL